MILWPVGMAVVIVFLVFRDPAIDYRLVAVGALVPDVVDAPFGGTRAAHTLVAGVVALGTVMLLTRRRRQARRRWLAVPIGMLLHLVVDGIWSRTAVFWWPLFGWRLRGPLPAFDHGATLVVLEELAGAAALLWCWRRFGLADRDRRRRLVTTGRLDPSLRPRD
jgi:hypothetical protein